MSAEPRDRGEGTDADAVIAPASRSGVSVRSPARSGRSSTGTGRPPSARSSPGSATWRRRSVTRRSCGHRRRWRRCPEGDPGREGDRRRDRSGLGERRRLLAGSDVGTETRGEARRRGRRSHSPRATALDAPAADGLRLLDSPVVLLQQAERRPAGARISPIALPDPTKRVATAPRHRPRRRGEGATDRRGRRGAPEVLGEHQDAVVAIVWLSEHASRATTRAMSFTAGGSPRSSPRGKSASGGGELAAPGEDPQPSGSRRGPPPRGSSLPSTGARRPSRFTGRATTTGRCPKEAARGESFEEADPPGRYGRGTGLRGAGSASSFRPPRYRDASGSLIVRYWSMEVEDGTALRPSLEVDDARRALPQESANGPLRRARTDVSTPSSRGTRPPISSGTRGPATGRPGEATTTGGKTADEGRPPAGACARGPVRGGACGSDPLEPRDPLRPDGRAARGRRAGSVFECSVTSSGGWRRSPGSCPCCRGLEAVAVGAQRPRGPDPGGCPDARGRRLSGSVPSAREEGRHVDTRTRGGLFVRAGCIAGHRPCATDRYARAMDARTFWTARSVTSGWPSTGCRRRSRPSRTTSGSGWTWST